MPEILTLPSFILLSLNTATGNSSGKSIAKVILPPAYTKAPLIEAAI